jgi:hypothetical protein
MIRKANFCNASHWFFPWLGVRRHQERDRKNKSQILLPEKKHAHMRMAAGDPLML